MAVPLPRLLVSLPESDTLRRQLEQRLPGISSAFATRTSIGPWPGVEALLVGTPERELPPLRAGLLPRLRFVQRIYAGLDGFPFDRFDPEVQIAGNVGGFAPYVAEQAVTLLLAIANDLVPNFERLRAGRVRPVVPPRWLEGRTALLLGFGAIARELAVRLRAFGVHILGLSRDGTADPLAERIYPAASLHEALGLADIVVDCRPLTRRTRGTIDRAALERMRSGALLVNVGRADTIDPQALYDHLRAHPEFRFGTDVLWGEDLATGTVSEPRPFASLSNFLATPHIAGVGSEPRERALSMALENLARFFAGDRPRHVVDRSEYEPSPGR